MYSGSGHYVPDGLGANAVSPMLQQQALQQQLGQTQLQQQLSLQGLAGAAGLTNHSLAASAATMGMAGLPTTMQSLGAMGGLAGAATATHFSNNASMGGGRRHDVPKNPPPANYVCHKCNIGGHWIQECPLNNQSQPDYNQPPPPNYSCHRCGVPGHWIKNCPTNGNPTFDNKPHLKVVQASENKEMMANLNSASNATSQIGGGLSSGITAQPPSKKRRLNQM